MAYLGVVERDHCVGATCPNAAAVSVAAALLLCAVASHGYVVKRKARTGIKMDAACLVGTVSTSDKTARLYPPADVVTIFVPCVDRLCINVGTAVDGDF